ncbi:MAG: hypothetical protein GY705_19915 [Bacteroidetes bacterium]|nr:hypothetical protein [Bacteroidota bacterium]
MLNTSHPHHYSYDTKHLLIEVLGGVRINNLSNLRVTLKLVNKANEYPMRHTLDLYNHSQVERFVRTAAEQIEMGTSVIRKTLQSLTTELENHRLSQLSLFEDPPIETKELTEKEKKTVVNFLKQKGLMARTNDLIGKSGVIGEELNRLLMYIIFTSRKMNRPLHCISLGSSGAGKTHLQSSVGELIPEEDKIEITILSSNAFYYFHKNELRNKLILIEDMDGAQTVLYPLRELKSKNKITKTVVHKDSKGHSQTIHLTVEGPVCIAGCTTQERVYEDNSNRSFLIYIDESKEQDERIMAYQRKLSAGKIDQSKEKETQSFMQNMQRVLQPVKVVNPYAEQLKIPAEVFKKRRTNAHYLQFIEAITFYHQYQREQKIDEETGEVYIETTLEDIEAANGLMKQVLLRKSDNLSGACRSYYEWLKGYVKTNKIATFTSKEMSLLSRRSITSIKRYHKALSDYGYLESVTLPKMKGYHYKVRNYEDYKVLQSRVESVLDKCLKALQPKSPKLAHV